MIKLNVIHLYTLLTQKLTCFKSSPYYALTFHFLKKVSNLVLGVGYLREVENNVSVAIFPPESDEFVPITESQNQNFP